MGNLKIYFSLFYYTESVFNQFIMFNLSFRLGKLHRVELDRPHTICYHENNTNLGSKTPLKPSGPITFLSDATPVFRIITTKIIINSVNFDFWHFQDSVYFGLKYTVVSPYVYCIYIEYKSSEVCHMLCSL